MAVAGATMAAMNGSEPRRRPTHLTAVAAALVVTFLWSSSWVLIRWGLDDEALEPLTFAALRYGLAALVLVAWVGGRRSLRDEVRSIDRSMVAGLVVLGVVFYAATQGAQFVAIAHQPAATSSIVLSWTPLLVALVAARALAEPPSARQVVGSLLVVAGAWLYFAGDLGATTVGMVAAIVGLGSNVAASLLGRAVNRRADLSPVVVTAVSMAVGAVVLVAVGVVTEGVPSMSARAWIIVGWLAVVNTAFAFTLWNLSLRRLSAVESAAINNTMLIQIGVLAWIFLDERLGPVEIVGMAAVSIGVFAAQTASASRSQRAESGAGTAQR